MILDPFTNLSVSQDLFLFLVKIPQLAVGTQIQSLFRLFCRISRSIFLPAWLCFRASRSVSLLAVFARFPSVSAPRVQAALVLAERGVLPLPARAEGGRAPQHDQRAAGGGRPHPAQVSPRL